MRDKFIKALANYLAGNQVEKSIRLQMGDPAAKEWALLRTLSDLRGYPTVEEAEKELREMLCPDPVAPKEDGV